MQKKLFVFLFAALTALALGLPGTAWAQPDPFADPNVPPPEAESTAPSGSSSDANYVDPFADLPANPFAAPNVPPPPPGVDIPRPRMKSPSTDACAIFGMKNDGTCMTAEEWVESREKEAALMAARGWQRACTIIIMLSLLLFLVCCGLGFNLIRQMREQVGDLTKKVHKLKKRLSSVENYLCPAYPSPAKPSPETPEGSEEETV